MKTLSLITYFMLCLASIMHGQPPMQLRGSSIGKVHSIFCSWNSGPQGDYHALCTYNRNGQMIERVDSASKDKHVYTYTPNNQLSAIDVSYGNGGIQTTTTVEYTQGMRIEKYYYQGQLSTTSRFTLDGTGKVIEQKVYLKDGKLQYSKKFTNDRNGNVLEERYDFLDGNSGSWRYGYDTRGNRVTESNFDHDGNLRSTKLYKYDANNNEIECTCLESSGAVFWKYTLRYSGVDPYGNWKGANRFDSDGDRRGYGYQTIEYF